MLLGLTSFPFVFICLYLVVSLRSWAVDAVPAEDLLNKLSIRVGINIHWIIVCKSIGLTSAFG